MAHRILNWLDSDLKEFRVKYELNRLKLECEVLHTVITEHESKSGSKLNFFKPKSIANNFEGKLQKIAFTSLSIPGGIDVIRECFGGNRELINYIERARTEMSQPRQGVILLVLLLREVPLRAGRHSLIT